MSKFSERLSELMLEKESMLGYELGEHIGLPAPMISIWKGGKSMPSLQNAVKLADYFQCPLDFLFGRNDNDKLDFAPKPLPSFHGRLVVILKEKDTSWYKVVQDTKISKSNYQDWRDGREPLMPTLIELANYLDMSLDYLVGREQ